MANDHDRIVIPLHLKLRMIETARNFRKEPTRSEAILWGALRGKKLNGIKFRRQQLIGPFIVDYYASDLRLVIEIDGPIHEQQQEADLDRQCILEDLGLQIVRFSASQVENEIEDVLEAIRTIVTNLTNKQAE